MAGDLCGAGHRRVASWLNGAVIGAGTDAGSLVSGMQRRGLVERTRLIAALKAVPDAPVVLVVGGGGYGKTTTVSQWLRDDPRHVAWLTVTTLHDDPTVLWADVAALLGDVDPTPLAADFTSVALPRVERAIAHRTRPFVLVIDDAHLLTGARASSVAQAVASSIPTGSQLVLVSRTEPDLALGRLRARGRVHTVARSSLAMDRDEAAALVAAAGFTLPRSVVDRLWERTEGWPVGLYLSTVALAEEADAEAAAVAFAGDDRLVTDYVREELLAVLSDRVREFLLGASVLDELDAEVCDHLLERDDSATVLSEAARSMQLLVPLDRRGGSFRMHHLLRDALRAELTRVEPARARALHARAAEWYEVRGQLDRGILHRQEAGDRAALEIAIFRAAPVLGGAGRTATIEAAFAVFAPEELRTSPALAVTSAWLAFVTGDMPSLRYWSGIASQRDGRIVLADGNRLAAHAALLRAVVGADGVEATRIDAVAARDLDRAGSPYRAIGRYLEGLALRVQGRRWEARDRLEEGEGIGAHELPSAQAHCLAQLAALAIEDGDWEDARRHVDRLDGLLDRYALRQRPAQGSSKAVAALVHAHVGDTTTARREAKRALFLVSMLSSTAPLASIDARLHLARALLLLGDLALARTLTRDAREMLALVPDGELLFERITSLEQATESAQTPIGVAVTPMTPAELRVLRYFPTHLTFAAIADELFVSRNTVKTQAISVYRKLGVSSRGAAVDAARGFGLLDDEL
jgi:LuxR family maltose regulon positive regulatory protein